MVKDIKAWDIVSDVLKLCASAVQPGMTTQQLNEIAEKRIEELGGESVNKGYKPDYVSKPFPAVICTSVNDVITHGVPNDIPLQEGDIINIDVGVKKNDICGDGALTVGVGKISSRNERLLYYSRRTLEEATKIVRAGVQVKEISRVIENFAKLNGFEPNIWYGGHAIGKEMHMAPFIHNVAWPNLGEEILTAGQMICIEPIMTFKGGDREGILDQDGWTFRTRDGKDSAFFENQILVTETGYEVLTTHIK